MHVQCPTHVPARVRAKATPMGAAHHNEGKPEGSWGGASKTTCDGGDPQGRGGGVSLRVGELTVCLFLINLFIAYFLKFIFVCAGSSLRRGLSLLREEPAGHRVGAHGIKAKASDGSCGILRQQSDRSLF